MATITLPKRQGMRRWRWIAAAIGIIVVALIAAFFLTRRSSSSTTAVSAAPVQRGTITAQVAGSGSIAPVSTLDLDFQAQGSVAEVLVNAGDTVKEGQVLARLDDRDLQSQVTNAQAQLASAQAQLAQAQEGNATPEDLTAAKASVTSSEANLQKTRSGSTTAADIASAQAQLRSAQAQLDALKNPSPDKLSAAQTTVKQADISVQQTRDNASAAKTKAEGDLNKATQSLTQAHRPATPPPNRTGISCRPKALIRPIRRRLARTAKPKRTSSMTRSASSITIRLYRTRQHYEAPSSRSRNHRLPLTMRASRK